MTVYLLWDHHDEECSIVVAAYTHRVDAVAQCEKSNREEGSYYTVQEIKLL